MVIEFGVFIGNLSVEEMRDVILDMDKMIESELDVCMVMVLVVLLDWCCYWVVMIEYWFEENMVVFNKKLMYWLLMWLRLRMNKIIWFCILGIVFDSFWEKV